MTVMQHLKEFAPRPCVITRHDCKDLLKPFHAHSRLISVIYPACGAADQSADTWKRPAAHQLLHVVAQDYCSRIRGIHQ